MGLSGSTTTNDPSKFAKPYIQQGANALQDVYGQNAGKIQSATDSVTALMPGALQNYQAGDANLTAARGYNADVLGGKYLNGNPYLDEMIAQSNNEGMNQTQAALGLRGLTGGSSYADIISRNAGKNALAMRYQDYGAERARMDGAAAQVPGMISADNARLSPVLGLLQAYGMPMDAAAQYAGGLGGLLGQYNTQKSDKSLGSVLGGMAASGMQAAAMASDRRLKTDIKHVGETHGGLPVYTYRYHGEPKVHMGVMAQEVAEMQPEALGPVMNGYGSVLYGEVR